MRDAGVPATLSVDRSGNGGAERDGLPQSGAPKGPCDPSRHHPRTQSNVERSHRGLVQRFAKPPWGQLHRGFESLPLRQSHVRP